MIVKKVKRTGSDKSKARQIGDLVDYIRYPHNTNVHEKVAHAGGRNFLTSTHNGQRAEMIALAQESVHSNMPVAHWIFSWRENEQPTRAQVDALVDIFLERMGLAEHQTVYGLHHNTDNYHVHIAVNRMHPHTEKVVQPHKGFDIEEAHKIVALVEQKQGWRSENNSRYAVLENGEIARSRRGKSIVPRPQAQDFERATGEKSAQRIAQERGYSIMKNASSWGELHENLAEKGLRFEKKGSGAILFVGDIAVKASSVDRAFSMSKLVKKLGEFVPAAEETERGSHTMQPEPVSTVNLEAWQQYQAERTVSRQHKEPDNTQQLHLQILKIRQQKERRNIVPSLAQYGFSMLNIARHFLKQKHREELRQLQQEIRSFMPKRRPHFETWLRGRGLHEQAARWRHRSRLEKKQPLAVSPPVIPNCTEAEQLNRYLAAVNAERVRVTCIRMKANEQKKVFILDKKDGASKGFTPEELQTRIPEMLWLQKRGENIYYTPISANRHHILIDDMTRESLEKLYKDGFKPAVILESSPGNYQCVLTFAKLQSQHDREVGNRLTLRLNKEYGDPKLSGAIHPHRAPGFGNFKPQYRSENGGFPRAKLLAAETIECAKALQMSQVLLRECTAATDTKKQTHPPRLAPNALRPGSTAHAYYAHFENIKRHLTIEDYSRVDAMIALRLRATGHSKEAVAEAINQCAPSIREKNEGRNWQRYADRTADYAFGMAGDLELAKHERYREHWQKIEGSDDKPQEQAGQEQSRLRIR